MSGELSHSYPLLKRQWPGRVRRLNPAHDKGIPDFLLSFEGAVWFTEIKRVHSLNVRIDLAPMQAHQLDELNADGLAGLLLVNVSRETEKWAVFHAAKFTGRDFYARDVPHFDAITPALLNSVCQRRLTKHLLPI